MPYQTGKCLLEIITGLLAYMSSFTSFCNSGISVTLNNNSNYSLCLDSNVSPLCNNSYESFLAQNFSKNKRNYPLPCKGSHVLGGRDGQGGRFSP